MSDNKKSVSSGGPEGSNDNSLKASEDENKMTMWLDVQCKKLDTIITSQRTTQVKYLLLYNFLFGCIFFYFNWVIQQDYSSYDMTRIQANLQGLLTTDICPFVEGTLRGDKKVFGDIQEMFLGFNQPARTGEKSHYADLGLDDYQFLTFNDFKDESKSKDCSGLKIHFQDATLEDNDAQIKILSNDHIVVGIDKMPKKLLDKIQDKLHKIVGHLKAQYLPFGIKYYRISELTHRKI